jgi:O-antigen/teichoic acid export membrane protein
MRPLKSANLMSWTVLSIRLAGFAILLPVALSRLSSAETSVWLLFSTIAGLQLLVDFGFSATFAREIAYGFAGGTTLEPTLDVPGGMTEAPPPNWLAIGRTLVAMRWVYRRLGLAMFAVLAGGGSLAVMHPISRIVHPAQGWAGWAVVVATTSLAVVGYSNSTLLVGANRVDMIKRWEAANGLLFLPLQLAALLLGGGLLGLVVVAQLGVLAQVLVNRHLARRITAGHGDAMPSHAESAQLLRGLWPAAWRTAVGAFTSFGVSQGMAILVANLLSAGEAASVQLALRVVQILSQFSQVPFYTKIPMFNRLRALRQDRELVRLATRAIRLSLGIFVASVIAIDLFVHPLLALVGSRTQFPGGLFWPLLAGAYLVERIGAMHVQLLLTSNRTIAHVANSVTAAVWIGLLAILWSSIGILALPTAMLLAYASFYTPWSSHLSRAALGPDGGWRFEARTSIVPAGVLLCYFLIAGLLR